MEDIIITMAARAKTLGKENDLAKLPELNARIILEELEARYKKDVIYVSVNLSSATYTI